MLLSVTSNSKCAFSAALLLIACVAGLFLAPREAGAAWRSVSAPSTAVALMDYLMQPPGTPDPGTGDKDTTDVETPVKDPTGGQQPSGGTLNPNLGSPVDTAQIRAFPGRDSAAVETIGPPAQFRPAAPKTGAPAPAVHAHHGIWGMQPLVLLAGLIALHILIVSTVAK